MLSLWKAWMEDSFEPSFLLPRSWWDTWCAYVSLDWKEWEATYSKDPTAAITTGGDEGVGEGEVVPPGPLSPPGAEAVAGVVAVGVERGVSRQGVAVGRAGEGLLAGEALSFRPPEAVAAPERVKRALRDCEAEVRGLEEEDGEDVKSGVGVGSRPVPVAVGLSAAVAVAARLSEGVFVADAQGEEDAAIIEGVELGEAVPTPAALCAPP